MGQDFQKLQEYKSLKDSLTKVWAVVDYDGEVELYESRELAESAHEDEEVREVVIKDAKFCQLHKDIFLAEEEEKQEYKYNEDDDRQHIDIDRSVFDFEDDDDDNDVYIPVQPPTPKPTTADIQSQLKDLAKFKGALPQKQAPTVATARPAQPVAQSAPALNNDGRLICYACGEPTKVVDTGFSKYSICTACGK